MVYIYIYQQKQKHKSHLTPLKGDRKETMQLSGFA